MTKHIIKTTTNNGLTVETWEFSNIGTNLRLDRYTFGHRPTTRHKAKPEKIWDRIKKRECNTDEPAVPVAVKQQAVDWLISTITVSFTTAE